jgi:hypothetical protein
VAIAATVEALYDKAGALPVDAEGKKMATLRNEMHRRRTGQ